MLRSLADAAQHRVVTTEMFIKALEWVSGRDLEGFSRQYVYGTGIPEVYYGYDLERKDSGGWAVQGEAHLLFTPHYRYDIVRAESGWDVLRRRWPQFETGRTTMMVPYQIALEGEPAQASARQGRPDRPRQSGQVVLEGRQDGFRIETDRRPVDVRLDPRGELLAWFYSAQGHPKRFRHYEAEDLAAAGELSAAESRYLEALESPAEADTRDPLSSRPDEDGIQGRVQDVKIRLALTRVYLDQGRLEESEEALDGIDRELETWDRMMFRMQRDALRSRLEILSGDYEPAYKRLKKTLRLASPRRARVPWRNLMLQLQLNTERAAVTEAYSLLAIAAHETGNRNVFLWALSEARARRVDVSALEPFESLEEGVVERAHR
jgi:tetratricopeptide (TPR) repeat protein